MGSLYLLWTKVERAAFMTGWWGVYTSSRCPE